ncbi:uncharacterized protein LOC134727172 [Mytilus trossulus]|uniref:uncharacterized protein LOC134727172 n=1 Tax=Mytilus trossulus TaxID=6551 RepID=UPI0030048B49
MIDINVCGSFQNSVGLFINYIIVSFLRFDLFTVMGEVAFDIDQLVVSHPDLFIKLKPSEIYFSQNRINALFRCRRSVGGTLDDIMEGRCNFKDLPMISVMNRDGKWVTADNRRLWVFRHLEKLGKCTNIIAIKTTFIPESKLNSENGGRTVEFYIGMAATGEWHKKVPTIEIPDTESKQNDIVTELEQLKL